MKFPRVGVRRFFSRNPTRMTVEGSGSAEDLLNRSVRSLQASDPDTERAWARLAARLDAGLGRENVGFRFRTSRFFRPALGGSLALAALTALVMIIVPRASEQTYSTTRAQQSTVLLPDSSVVTLNHTTTLSVRIDRGGARLITLEGEGFFQVRRNGHPFVVQTPSGRVEVLGTSFNVKSRAQTTEVDVLHGRVRFGSTVSGHDDGVILTQDQHSRCTAGGAPTLPITVAHNLEPGWMEGKLQFDQKTLREVCGELEDTYDIAIRFEDPSLPGTSVTGTIEARSADSAVNALSLLTGHRYRKDHATFVLY
jgi:ferric-dicitrate binding protein FerR (iron transport regulator)